MTFALSSLWSTSYRYWQRIAILTPFVKNIQVRIQIWSLGVIYWFLCRPCIRSEQYITGIVLHIDFTWLLTPSTQGSITEYIYNSLLTIYEKYLNPSIRGRLLQCLGLSLGHPSNCLLSLNSKPYQVSSFVRNRPWWRCHARPLSWMRSSHLLKRTVTDGCWRSSKSS